MNGVSRLMVQRNEAATSVLAALMIHGRKGKAGIAPDFDWLAGMLSYIDEVVRGQHYRDEEIWLLKPLEKQMPDLRPRLARMRRDHIGSGGYCVRMAEALANWKRGWERGIDMYLDNARDHYRLARALGRAEYEAALCRRMGRQRPPQAPPRIDPDQGLGAGPKATFATLS
jgi:hemerythrin-like domain-containing protein